MADSAKNPVQSAQRIFDILELLAREGRLPLSRVCSALALHKTTAHRLLSSLITMGYAKKDGEGRYQLTFKLLELSGLLLENIDIVALAHPWLERLAQQTREAVHLVQRDGREIVYIDKVEAAAGSIRMVSRIGVRRPMYCTAVGKAMMAQMTRREVAALFRQSEVAQLTPHTIVRLEELYRALDEVRERGYALDNEENELGVRCIAVGLNDYKGRANCALSVSAPLQRMDDRRIGEIAPFLLEAQRGISRELGYKGE